MRVVLIAVALMSAAATAQELTPMVLALGEAKLKVCAVDVNSRQCELLTGLWMDTLLGRNIEPSPPMSAAEKVEFRKALAKAVEAGRTSKAP